MRKKENPIKRVFAFVLAFGMAFTSMNVQPMSVKASTGSSAATYQPMTIASGFNADVFLDSGETIGNTDSCESSGKVTSDKKCFYTEDTSISTGGFPADGLIEDETYPSLTWQLASYKANNALRLAPGDSGTLTFSTIGCYQKLYFLVNAGGVGTGSSASMSVKVTYSDNSVNDETFTVVDWYDSTNSVTAKYQRTGNGTSADGSTSSGPYITRCEMNIDTSKLISKIQISNSANNSGVYVCVYGVTGLTSDIGKPTLNAATDVLHTGFTASWSEVDKAASYRLDLATDANFTQMVSGYNNLKVDTNTLQITGITASETYYCRVRAVGSDGGQSLSSDVITVTTGAHEWVYSAEGSVLTAKCTVCGPQSLTLNVPDSVYSGSAYPQTVFSDSEKSAWTAVGLAVPTVYYEGVEGTAYTSSTTAPTNVGTYRASITGGGNTAETMFTITQKSIQESDVKITLAQDSFEYDGESKAPAVTVQDQTRNCTMQQGTDYAISGDTTGTDIKYDYNITIEGTGNYTGTVEKTWKITKKITKIAVEPTASAITYGQTLTDSALTGGTAKTSEGDEIPGRFVWADAAGKPTVADSGVTEYEVIFTPDDTEEYEQVTFGILLTVNPKLVTLSWTNTVLTYNGSAQNPKAVISNLEEEDSGKVDVTVSGAQIQANTALGYTATATDLKGDAAANYKLSDTVTDNQKSFNIYPKKITASMVKADTTYKYTGSDITPTISVEDVIVGADGKESAKTLVKDSDYTLDGAMSGCEVGDYTVTVSGIASGNYTGTVVVAYKITDSFAPTGTIKVSTNEWQSLLGSVSFDLLYKERQTVTIEAEDEGSGVDKIYFYLTSSNTAMSETELAALPDTKWRTISNGGSFTIEPDNKYVIYAKITDISGNVTFISSNGIVVDKTAPAITGIENNKTYCAEVMFAVSDAIGFASVKIDDVEQGIGGSYTISASTEKAAHTIVAEDITGNKTTFTITINAGGEHSFGAWTVTTDETCEEVGVESHTCTACGLVETREIPALGHNYKADANEDAHIVWSPVTVDGVVTGYTAKAYFICTRNPNHAHEESCEVSRNVVQKATTEQEGKVTYTATVNYGGREFRASRTATIEKLEALGTNGNSNIYTATSVAEKAPETTIDDGLDTALVKDLMSPADEASYNDLDVATDVTIYLEVQNITGAVTDTEKDQVEAQMADFVTEALNTAEDVEVQSGAAYVDLSMYKNVKTEKTDGNGEPIEASDTTTQITDTGTEITITMAIPEDIPQVANGFTRTYNVVRVHDGNAEVLPSEQNGNQLTFKTSKFSTYAVTYVDVKNSSAASSSGSGTSYVPVNKVRIETAATTLTKQGETLQLTADVAPQNATDQKLTWISSDPSVATVDANGKVTAVGDGTVTITAKASNGKIATITITVKIEQESEKTDSGNTDIKLDKSFAGLRLASATATKTKVTLNWTEVEGADGYVVYGAPCNTKDKTYKVEKLAVIKNGAMTTYKDKGLKSGTYYKYVVKAYKLVDGKKVFISRSKTIHVTTAGGKYGNAKSVKVKDTSVVLRTGKNYTIKASLVLTDKPVKEHTEIHYESTNSKVATVNSEGVITAKSKGTCYVYAYAQNGVYQKIKVTVK